MQCQGRDETIASFVATLKQLSKFCKHGNSLHEMLRDRIIVGVLSEKIQLRLLAEPNLTYERCLELAQSIEMAEKDRQQLKDSRVKEDHVFYSHAKRGQMKQHQKVECYRCGSAHLANQC